MFLNPVEQHFIREHLTDNVQQLVLKSGKHKSLDIKKLANQIAARQKARYKLQSWYENFSLFFPSPLSVEQASSEQTALYKASLISGDILLDLTGGMGVDTWAFSKQANVVLYAERVAELAAITAHNLQALGATNVSVQAIEGPELLRQQPGVADWIYLDPARRDEHGGKVVRLTDCEPDVTALWPLLLEKGRSIMIKTSPLLDLETTIRQLPGLTDIYIVAVRNEVKEVLLIKRQLITDEPIGFHAVNLLSDQTVSFSFKREEERTVDVQFADPESYIYEPNAAILKAGAFRSLAARLNLKKLAPHSHLYTSTEPVTFPYGRTFLLKGICKPDRKALQPYVAAEKKANLTVRNFPQQVDELKKKLGLRDGGDIYILATSLKNGDKKLLITEKLTPLNHETTKS
ncbi:SAM-dependent methyltransferase [Arsenicibacter rosenii]|uniref:SAM-dependent methyltransferase n=1 Tax=Arsenicibacter rosenii TaxID=1750698 RepID=A0A1S2VDS3_9BACT|nr:SAM-dependent methyltransferase [Arsenicibacter rosenii]